MTFSVGDEHVVQEKTLRTHLREARADLQRKNVAWEPPDAQEAVMIWLASLPRNLTLDEVLDLARLNP